MTKTEKSTALIKVETKILIAKLLAQNTITLPPHPAWEQKIKEAENSNIGFQREAHAHSMRCDQVKELGFHKIGKFSNAIKMLMGAYYTRTETGPKRISYDYHHGFTKKSVVGSGWGVDEPIIWIRESSRKERKWFKTHIKTSEEWRVESVYDLNLLNVLIPFDILSIINKLKKSQIFSCYEVFKSNTDQCLLLGVLHEVQDKADSDGMIAYNSARFFIATW